MKQTKTNIRKEIKFFADMKVHYQGKIETLGKDKVLKEIVNLDRLISERQRILGYCKVVV